MIDGSRRWVTASEAAEYFKISAKTLYSLVGRRRLPPGSFIKIGRALRFDLAKIEAADRGEGR
jgi:excisionase family DNA binding protein